MRRRVQDAEPSAFIGIATPWPTVLLALTDVSKYGVRREIAGMIGAMLSDFILIEATAFGPNKYTD